MEKSLRTLFFLVFTLSFCFIFTICAGNVDIQLKASWGKTSLAHEASEFIFEHSPKDFLPFIKSFENFAPEQRTKNSKPVYDWILQQADKIFKSSPIWKQMLKFTTSIRHYSPKIEFFNRLAENHLMNFVNSDKPKPKSFFLNPENTEDDTFSILCENSTMKLNFFEKDTLNEINVQTKATEDCASVYPFDHLLNQNQGKKAQKTLILYSNFEKNKQFSKISQKITEKCEKDSDIACVFRPFDSSLLLSFEERKDHFLNKESDKLMNLQGYGVELQHKTLEYKQMDDRIFSKNKYNEKGELLDSNNQEKSENVKEKVEKPKSELEKFLHDFDYGVAVSQLSADQKREFGIKATNLILQSIANEKEDDYSLLKAAGSLAQRFPSYMRGLSQLPVNETLKSLLNMQQGYLPEGTSELYLNGFPVNLERFSLFWMKDFLTSELKFIENLQNGAGISAEIAKEALFSTEDGNKQQETEQQTTPMRFSLFDNEKELRERVFFFNDLEKNTKPHYSNFPREVSTLLQPSYYGQMHFISRNLFHLVIFGDISTNTGFSGAFSMFDIFQRGYPINYGFYPISIEDLAEISQISAKPEADTTLNVEISPVGASEVKILNQPNPSFFTCKSLSCLSNIMVFYLVKEQKKSLEDVFRTMMQQGFESKIAQNQQKTRAQVLNFWKTAFNFQSVAQIEDIITKATPAYTEHLKFFVLETGLSSMVSNSVQIAYSNGLIEPFSVQEVENGNSPQFAQQMRQMLMRKFFMLVQSELENVKPSIQSNNVKDSDSSLFDSLMKSFKQEGKLSKAYNSKIFGDQEIYSPVSLKKSESLVVMNPASMENKDFEEEKNKFAKTTHILALDSSNLIREPEILKAIATTLSFWRSNEIKMSLAPKIGFAIYENSENLKTKQENLELFLFIKKFIETFIENEKAPSAQEKKESIKNLEQILHYLASFASSNAGNMQIENMFTQFMNEFVLNPENQEKRKIMNNFKENSNFLEQIQTVFLEISKNKEEIPKLSMENSPVSGALSVISNGKIFSFSKTELQTSFKPEFFSILTHDIAKKTKNIASFFEDKIPSILKENPTISSKRQQYSVLSDKFFTICSFSLFNKQKIGSRKPISKILENAEKKDKNSLASFEFNKKTDQKAIEVVFIVNPLSVEGQKFFPIVTALAEHFKFPTKVVLNPKMDTSSIVESFKSWYSYVFEPNASFDEKTQMLISPRSKLEKVPSNMILTLNMDVPETWLVESTFAIDDLDNIDLENVQNRFVDKQKTKNSPKKGKIPTLKARYQLENIVVTGNCFEFPEKWSQIVKNNKRSLGISPMNPTRGLQLVLESDLHQINTTEQINSAFSNPLSKQITIVMANYGYYQLKANPAPFNLYLAGETENSDHDTIYDILHDTTSDYYSFNERISQTLGNNFSNLKDSLKMNKNPQKSKIEIILTHFDGPFVYLHVERLEGKENQELLKEEHQPQKKNGIISSFFSKKQENPQMETINLYSIASGHMYERLLRIMMLSVNNVTSVAGKTKVKFYMIKNYFSPQFKWLLPEVAKEYGMEIEMVTYKWPTWLFKQTQKQRLIWAYKILFLDVIFPLDKVHRIIYLDADNVAKSSFAELFKMDIGTNAPIAMTPMCDSNTDVKGYMFWTQGYWKNHLRGKPYHISALYLVDVDKFRKMYAGDYYRMIYDSLAKDPNSLSNLDQDLPNYAQHTIPMYSLPQEWLWCETWCTKDTFVKAKSIDLCNNPLTKEHKLDSARRINGQIWMDLDEKVRQFEVSFWDKMKNKK